MVTKRRYDTPVKKKEPAPTPVTPANTQVTNTETQQTKEKIGEGSSTLQTSNKTTGGDEVDRLVNRAQTLGVPLEAITPGGRSGVRELMRSGALDLQDRPEDVQAAQIQKNQALNEQVGKPTEEPNVQSLGINTTPGIMAIEQVGKIGEALSKTNIPGAKQIGGGVKAVSDAGLRAGAGVLNKYLPGVLAGDAQDAKDEVTKFTTSKEAMVGIINMANNGDIDDVQAVDMYNRELVRIMEAEGRLKLMTRNEFGKELSRAEDELTRINAFYRSGLKVLNGKLINAMAVPNPENKLNLLDIPVE